MGRRTVDVAKNVETRADAGLHVVEQVDAAGPVAAGAQVPVPHGRAVRHEHVRVGRYSLPERVDRLAALGVEGPVVKLPIPVYARNL